MAFYDVERFIKDVKSLYKEKLNAEILLVDADKNDYVLDPIDSDAWYVNNINEGIWNYNEFVVLALRQNPNGEVSQNDNMIKRITIDIEVVAVDAGEDDDNDLSLFWRLLRYTRALEQVAYKNFDKFQGVTKSQVQSLIPININIDGKPFKSAGISLSASLTAY